MMHPIVQICKLKPHIQSINFGISGEQVLHFCNQFLKNHGQGFYVTAEYNDALVIGL